MRNEENKKDNKRNKEKKEVVGKNIKAENK